jgi:hypothetical protein
MLKRRLRARAFHAEGGRDAGPRSMRADRRGLVLSGSACARAFQVAAVAPAIESLAGNHRARHLMVGRDGEAARVDRTFGLRVR